MPTSRVAIQLVKSVLVSSIAALFATVVVAQKNIVPNTDNARPFVLGVVHEIKSQFLGETRTLNIYLPEGFNKNDTITYPVAYLLDGGADEDFIHIAGLYQFNNFSWINRVPKTIVVGIATIDRRRDFTFKTEVEKEKTLYPSSGHSNNFISFLKKELIPFIEKNYNGSASATIIGQSLGGLLATEILLNKPSLFSRYIIVSPSLWWSNGSLLARASKLLRENNLSGARVYIGVGKEGLTPSSPPRIMEADAKQLAEKIVKANRQNRVYYDYLPKEDHATIMHQAVYNALRVLYPKQAAK